MAEGCPQLRWLNLTWCVKLTDEGVRQLALGCRRLRWLSLHGIVSVSLQGLTELSSSCARTLHTLDVQGCSSGGLEADQLAELFPRVRTWKVHG